MQPNSCRMDANLLYHMWPFLTCVKSRDVPGEGLRLGSLMGQDELIPATEAEETLIEEVEGQVLDTTMAVEQEGQGQHKKIKNRLYTQENLRWWDNAH